MLYGEPDFDKYHEFCEEGLAHMLIEEAMITLNACSAIFMKNKVLSHAFACIVYVLRIKNHVVCFAPLRQKA